MRLILKMANDVNEIIKEKINLRNKLSVERIKSREQKAYLEAYQHLYVMEVVKNVQRDKAAVL